MTTQKEIMKELYDAAILTVGAIGVSLISKKVTGEPLGTPTSLRGTLKLAAAFGISAFGVKILQDKKALPENPFK